VLREELIAFFREVIKYTRTKASIDLKIGGEFSLLDGKITGKYICLVKVFSFASLTLFRSQGKK